MQYIPTLIDLAGALYIGALAVVVFRIGRARHERRHANRSARTSRLASDPMGTARGYPANRGRGGAR